MCVRVCVAVGTRPLICILAMVVSPLSKHTTLLVAEVAYCHWGIGHFWGGLKGPWEDSDVLLFSFLLYPFNVLTIKVADQVQIVTRRISFGSIWVFFCF